MTFSLLESFATIPGSIYLIGTAVSADHNFAVLIREIDEEDVRPYGQLLLQIYIPNPIDEYSTCVSHSCYTRSEVIFTPIPVLGSLNLRVGFYSPVRSLPRTVEIWTEPS